MITLHANGTIEGINNNNFNSSLPAGHILQVQQATTKSNYASTGTSYENLSDLNCSITPISSSSLLIFKYHVQYRTYRNGASENFVWIAISDDDGSSYLAENYHRNYDYGGGGTILDIGVSSQHSKTAGSTNTRTYKLYGKRNSSSDANAFELNPANNQNSSGVTIMEIAV